MATPSTTSAKAYARSLLDLANDQQIAWEIAGELTQTREILDADPGFEQFLANPSIGPSARLPVLGRAFEGQVQPLYWNFLRLLNEKGRLSLIREIEEAYSDMIDEQFGKVEVDVTVAQRLSDEELENVRRTVSETLKRDAVVHQYVDESIIGGLILRVQDKLIDTSVRAQLAAIRQQMLSGKPKAATIG